MKRGLPLLLLAALAPLSSAIVIVPPVAYFLTLSLGTFLANSLVSLVVFGVLKGATARTYAGRSAYELLYQLLNAGVLMLAAFPGMLVAVLVVYPIDPAGDAFAGLLAGALALASSCAVSLKELRASDARRQKALLASLFAFAAFVAVATAASAALAVTRHSIG